ncbi:hypothetical protein NHE_0187 [Neorickettsia helminthoeca str. Oregon]|uniref:Uncharacterized protein n=2 Tax=Neorickettsia helminthoeca TaxID=33994 RepID=X5GVR1_9RICK|nr:hypothetical protein NHE_0187 [Neorickettsia helminthoeca str. Oregon]
MSERMINAVIVEVAISATDAQMVNAFLDEHKNAKNIATKRKKTLWKKNTEITEASDISTELCLIVRFRACT